MILSSKKSKNITKALALSAAFLFLSACSSLTLADDIAPPPGYQLETVPNVPAQAPVSGPVYPLVAPDPAAGAVIYLDKCAPCHGLEGQGNGPRAADLPNPTTPFSSAVVARAASPEKWYEIVTRGNINRYMPPFPSLSERERWDVVAYIRTLSSSPASLELGQEIYEASCAACHGEGGRGNGVQAANLSRPLPDFNSQAYMAQKAPQDFFTLISAGIPPEMPPFHSSLEEKELWAVSEYLYTFSYASTIRTASEEAPVPETSQEEIEETREIETVDDGQGLVSGEVFNASSGEPISNTEVTLHAFDGMQLVLTDTVLTDEEGYFVFENIEMMPDRVFLATVEYHNATYASNVATSSTETGSISLSIHAYETTTDQSSLFIDRLHIFFDYSEPGIVQVIELYIISNSGRQTVVGEGEGAPVVTFPLPEGATNLQFQEGELGQRYLPVSEGFADTIPVRPAFGEYQVLFGYELPYDRQLELVHSFSMPVDAVVILQPADGVRVRSDLLTDQGVRDVQGISYQMYSGGPFTTNSSLALTLVGRPGSGLVAIGSIDTLVIGVGAFGIVLIVAGLLLYRRNQLGQVEVEEALEEDEPGDDEDDPDSLVDAIIALDDQYQAGELPEEAYRARRGELKRRLKELSSETER
jgi:mono/diheme cytochrome c family protein